MRLTLRTLLAYLDDILEPSQAREIGEKINESSFASSLVSRIREVMRRRRLTAPALSGSGAGVDPNTMAEYLDNTLSPEAVADVEKVCLESDVHLAEVAACHQILTLVLGEPVDITSETRDRMYALGPVKSNAPANVGGLVTTASSTSSPLATNAVASIVGQAEDASEQHPVVAEPAAVSLHAALPDYLRPRSFWRRSLPYAAVAGALLIWLGLLAFDVSGPNVTQTSREPSTADADGSGGDPSVAKPSGDSSEPRVAMVAPLQEQRTPQDAAGSGENPDLGATSPSTNAPGASAGVPFTPPEEYHRSRIDAPPPPDLAEAPGSVKPVPETPGAVPAPGPTGTTVAEGKSVPTEAPAPESMAGKSRLDTVGPTTPAPSADSDANKVASRTTPESTTPSRQDVVEPILRVPPAIYTSPEGVLLHYQSRDQKWYVLPRRAFVHSGDRLAVPAPFEGTLEVDGGKALVILQGGTRIRSLPPKTGIPVGIEVEYGRVLIRPTKSTEAFQPITLRLEVRGESWQLDLLDPITVVGVEIVPREPDSFEQDFGVNSYTGAIYVTSGRMRLIDASRQEFTINGPGTYPLTPELRSVMGDEGVPAAGPQPLVSLPRWFEPASPSAMSRSYAKLFEREFEPSESVDLSVASLAEDRRPELSRLAVECLGLVDAIDPLVDVLQRGEHEEARKAAIAALRTWLPMNPLNRETLKAVLTKHFPPEVGETIYRLLWGFNADDARNRIISEQLIDWMASDDIAVRELAFLQVYRLTDKKYDYRPNASAQQRQSSINRWMQHIKDGALLPPKMQ